jgi:hypothetical protein
VVVVVLVAATVAFAVTGSVAYWWVTTHPFTPNEPSPSPVLVPENVTQITAYGTSDGPGGCSGPGLGATEYCYTFGFFDIGGFVPIATAHSESTSSVTTASTSFYIQAFSGTSGNYTNIPYQNVTLMSQQGDILATYSPSFGWTASLGNSLPISLATTQTCVLNIGSVSDAGDTFDMQDGGGGASMPLPT